MAFVGGLYAFGVIHSDQVNLDGERNVPSVVSALLLLSASAAALAHAFAAQRVELGRWTRRTNMFLVALLAYTALDEFGRLHEKAEHYSGVDWQTL
jgi:hypothetical protein